MPVTRSARMIVQSPLSSNASEVYTSPLSTRVQVTEVWLANTGNETRKVTLYAHGTGVGNTILSEIELKPKGTVILEDLKIVLSENEVLGAKQDGGTDVILTAYGVREVYS